MRDVLHALGHQLGATPVQLLGVVVAAFGVYAAFLIMVRIFGPRSLHGMSTFDAILVIMFGAVAARAILGERPTLTTGVVGLATLFTLEALFGQLRATLRGRRLLNARPILVMADGRPLEAPLRRMHLTDAELNSALRRAGIRSHAEVACVVFEPTGHLSVMRRGEDLDPALFDDVVGREHLPGDLRGPDRPAEGGRGG